MKTIFPTIKPTHNSKSISLPTDTLNKIEAGLTTAEWLYLIHTATGGQDILYSLGSRTTLWRIKKSLTKKGYL